MNNTFASEFWKPRENNLRLACGHKVILGLFDVGRFFSFLLLTLDIGGCYFDVNLCSLNRDFCKRMTVSISF